MTGVPPSSPVPLPEPAVLRRVLVARFSVDELYNLCQDLNIDHEALPRENKEAIARELVAYCQRHERTADLLSAIDGVKLEAPVPGECPYKGLQYFDEADANLFFGRELLTAELVGRLRQDRLLVVVGASGSGKSSVLRAGLVPAISHGALLADGTFPPEGSTHWLIHVISPTPHPLEALAASLIRNSASVRTIYRLVDDLAHDPRTLHLYALEILSGSVHRDARLLLIVDQFEELFTACESEVERKAFVDNLLYATALPTSGPTTVVIALRADFYAHCARLDNLREALGKCQEYIGPMSSAELRRAIEEPARRNSWKLESGLVDLLLRDIGDEPGALPLLSHALLETWKRRQGRTLTFSGYTGCGKLSGAIAKAAEAVFAQLKREEQAVTRDIFLRLTELGEGTQDTRRRAKLSELISKPGDAPTVEAVLKKLADARLVTTAAATVEVAHEALIHEWPRLRDWLAEDREGLLIRRRLTEAAGEWENNDRNESYLYRGTRLAQVNKWAEDPEYELSVQEREFLSASRALQAQDLVSRRALQILTAIGVIAILFLLMWGTLQSGFQLGTAYKAVDTLRGVIAPSSSCTGDFASLMPKDWTFVSQTALDTDGNGQYQCVVLYRFDTAKNSGETTPVSGVVYRQDHGRPRWLYPQLLTLPEGFYLGVYKVTARAADVVSGSEGPELIVEDTNPDGNITQASIFSWRDNLKGQPDRDPSLNPEMMSYKPLGLFLGDTVKVEKDKVTVLKRRTGTRSQLTDRIVYVPRDKKNYYKLDSIELVDPAEAEVVTLVGADDPTSSPYPEKTVLAFYENVQEDAKLDGLMTREALGSLKAGQLPYGCPVGRDQLDRVLIQSVDWSRGTLAQPQVVVSGKCKLRDGSFRDMTFTAWQLERLEGKWRIKGATQY